MTIKLTLDNVENLCGAHEILAAAALPELQDAMDKFGISDNANRAAAFLANIGVESGGLQMKRESLYYSAARLAVVWPLHYAVDPHAKPLVPNALANSLQYNEQALGNDIYANRLGNGDKASGDGYKYRGGFYIQTTGKANYQELFAALGIPTDSDPTQFCASPRYCALAAAYYFQKAGCNELADKDMFSATVTHINGEAPCDANNGPLRLSRYRAGVAALK